MSEGILTRLRSRLRRRGAGIGLGLLLACLCAVWGCGKDPGPPAPPPAAGEAGGESFTFFEMSRHSVLDEAIRARLKRELGAEAVARRGLVDLELVGPGWLASHLPSLDALNRRLNKDFRERVEHDVLVLRYNYPTRSSPAFDTVRLVFDLPTRRPLYFDILANESGAEILQVLKDKYGPPVRQADARGEALLWEKRGDRLMIVPRTNRLGRPEYLIGIYFVTNLEALADRDAGGRAGSSGGGGAKAF